MSQDTGLSEKNRATDEEAIPTISLKLGEIII